MPNAQILAVTFLVGVPMWAILSTILALRQRAKRKTAEQTAINTAEQLKSIEERFKPIIDQEIELERLKQTAQGISIEIDTLRGSYREKKELYDQLLKQVAIFDDKLAFAEMGLYEPHFNFTDSELYKTAISHNREAQKKLITSKVAAICKTDWVVEGSKTKGQAMTNRNIKLTLRAFNNECDAAVANVRWNNANAMEKRVVNAKQQIDKLNTTTNIHITDEYLNLKLEELMLTHEYREKLKAEKEERAEQARAAREEQKLIRDMERAEEEEARYQNLLNKAKVEASKATGSQIEAYNEKIRLLENDLAAAHSNVERAQAMAEKTRSGYVYIISNVGSFGDEVVKIGLTRRLDPTDRVRELGDASVPFLFDTHAIIYSDNAPALERALHNEFEKSRINTQNFRKEFFRASITEVEQAVKRLAPEAPFFRDIEAQEYRETLARRNAMLSPTHVSEIGAPPDCI